MIKPSPSALWLAACLVSCSGDEDAVRIGTADGRDRDESTTTDADSGEDVSRADSESSGSHPSTNNSVELLDASVGGIGIGVWVPLGEDPDGAARLLVPEQLGPDERPASPGWEPAIPLAGSGWRSSSAPLCLPFKAAGDGWTGLWADDRGVTLLRTGECWRPLDTPCTSEATAVYFNDGTEWTEVFIAKQTKNPVSLVGVDIEGTTVLHSFNELFFLHSDGSGAAVGSSGDKLHVRGAFLSVTSNRIYGTGHPTLFALEGGKAMGLGNIEPSSVGAVWGDRERVFIAGDSSFFVEYSVEHGQLSVDPSVPAGDYTTVWGFEGGSNDEVWLGNSVGQLLHRLDGAWTVIDTNTGERVETLWGAEGTVYFHTAHAFGRASPAGSEVLISFDVTGDQSVQALWGLGPREVFVALHDDAREEFACGGLAVFWFDGETFHRM